MQQRRKRDREFVSNIFTQRDKLRVQELKEDIHYHFTDNLDKIDNILNEPYRETVVAILI